MSFFKDPFAEPEAPKPRHVDPPITPVALVQCLRSGHATAHVLNHLGESLDPRSTEWLMALSVHLTGEGRAVLRRLAFVAGAGNEDTAGGLLQVHEDLTFALGDPEGWSKASERERAEITARIFSNMTLALAALGMVKS